MHRIATALLSAIGLIHTPCAHAQAPAAPSTSLKFEVASLKASQPGGRGGGIRPAPGGQSYLATNAPLRLFIMVAYRLKTDQIFGGPGWMDTETYNMNAKAERPSNTEELHIMLQNLLAERFHLQFHKEMRELPVYAMTVDKSGPKMHPHEAASAGDPWIDVAIDKVVQTRWTAKFVPMDYLAWRLSLALDRPVIDLTNLKGGYDFDLAYTRELPPGLPEGALLNGAPIDTSGPTIFEALRQQLGLKLDRQKGPVYTLVVDHAEKPIEN
jgi:uncharacterized protein (TIGR03435 family)